MKKVLIVDDAKLMRNIIKNILLDKQEYIIFEAENGHDAVECYKNNHPDVVTMDITMELKNGLDAAKDILTFDPRAKIIMVTSLGQEKLVNKCIQAGIKDFITKPFSKERVHMAISRVLEMN